jgi:hypothetical protein
MLSCKHGSAYKLTKQSVSEFVAAMKFQGARSGVLVTPGTVDSEARKSAEDARIELVDGQTLWPEVSPLLPQSLNDEVRKAAAQLARRRVMLSVDGCRGVGPGSGPACRRTADGACAQGRHRPGGQTCRRGPGHRRAPGTIATRSG